MVKTTPMVNVDAKVLTRLKNLSRLSASQLEKLGGNLILKTFKKNIGASRQQVTEYLNEFDREKIILREGRRIIVNPKSLGKVIESRP